MSDSFVTPWTVARQTPLSMGFSRQECWSGWPFPMPGNLPNPGIERLLLSRILYHWASWEDQHLQLLYTKTFFTFLQRPSQREFSQSHKRLQMLGIQNRQQVFAWLYFYLFLWYPWNSGPSTRERWRGIFLENNMEYEDNGYSLNLENNQTDWSGRLKN